MKPTSSDLSLNSHFDDRPEDYNAMRDCWLNTRRADFISGRLDPLLGREDSQILEVGSGTGRLLYDLSERWPKASFTGVEPLPSYVQFAQKNHSRENVVYVNSTAENFVSPHQTKFNVVISNDVLHHVESLEKTVEALSQAAAQNCVWVAIEPNVKNVYAMAGQALKSGEKNFFPGKFVSIAHRFGWELSLKRYIFLIPPFIKEPPNWLKKLESKVEGFPFLGGGVVLELVYRNHKV